MSPPRRWRQTLWVSDTPGRVLAGGWVRDLLQLPIDRVAVMVDRSERGWNPLWTAEQLRELRRQLPEEIAICLVWWPDPDMRLLLRQVSAVAALVAACRADQHEMDVEWNWKPERVVGFASLDEASEFLADLLPEVGAEACLTTHSGHAESGPKARLLKACRRIRVQVYALYKRGRMRVSWDGPLGPVRFVGREMADLIRLPEVASGQVEVEVGLATWLQTFPGRQPEEAMRAAWEAARAWEGPDGLRIAGVAWWDSRHVLGALRNGYAWRFLRALGT